MACVRESGHGARPPQTGQPRHQEFGKWGRGRGDETVHETQLKGILTGIGAKSNHFGTPSRIYLERKVSPLQHERNPAWHKAEPTSGWSHLPPFPFTLQPRSLAVHVPSQLSACKRPASRNTCTTVPTENTCTA